MALPAWLLLSDDQPSVKEFEPFSTVTGEHRVPRVLVACEDPVLLRAVARIISWRRPQWLVDGVVGPESTRDRLQAEAYDVVVVCLEVDSPAGGETLSVARTICPAAVRIACSRAPCEHPEVAQASERIVGSATVSCLVSTLDRALRAPAELPRVEPPVASA
jgi:hypothetical protein